jgi:gamma-glutamyl hydrolase
MRIMLSLTWACSMVRPSSASDRPVIGVVSHPVDEERGQGPPCFGECEELNTAYSKFLESGGARVVRIPYSCSLDEMDALMGQINGLFFPGGEDRAVSSSLRHALSKAIAMNDGGDFFPVWGTCLGMEWLVQVFADEDDVLSQFNANNISLPLDFTPDAASSRMFADMPKDIMTKLSEEPITMNSHHRGIDPLTFRERPGLDAFDILATAVDRDGLEFVAAMESRSYPFYGIQWHPEKSVYEFGVDEETGQPYEAINHSRDAIAAAFHVAQFFVGEARKSRHKTEKRSLLYGSATTTAGAPKCVEAYIFLPPGEIAL